eukprot:c27396_g1_i2 orf=520-1962(+)
MTAFLSNQGKMDEEVEAGVQMKSRCKLCNNFFNSLKPWHLTMRTWMVLVSLSALLILCHFGLSAERPWLQLRGWQIQLSRYFPLGSRQWKEEKSVLDEQMRVRNASHVQGEGATTHQHMLFRNASFIEGQTEAASNLRVAVCLVGGARSFELTGPSINKYLLQANNNTDVFLHAPLDNDAYKFSLLKDIPNLVHVRIFTPSRIAKTWMHAELLSANGSPNGIQGLLQYFNLVEGCLHMIKEYQSRNNFVYDWIVRTRVDDFWNGPIPPLNELNPEAYIVPYGSQFGGLNDRLGIGNWKTSEIALPRFTSLLSLWSKGFRKLNSETAFKCQLQVGRVKYEFKDFPFCILSHRSYGWPPQTWGVPVISISSKGPMNGAKCRPCTPVAKGEVAKSILKALAKSWAGISHNDGVELCDPRHDWEVDWKDLFDSIAGPGFADVRRQMQNETMFECIEQVGEFQRQVEIWDAPLPATICEKGSFLR